MIRLLKTKSNRKETGMDKIKNSDESLLEQIEKFSRDVKAFDEKSKEWVEGWHRKFEELKQGPIDRVNEINKKLTEIANRFNNMHVLFANVSKKILEIMTKI
jgi:uncharacterized coiled-coil DUF342 family protein